LIKRGLEKEEKLNVCSVKTDEVLKEVKG